jgi:formylglycine-generating enzyme required for sulfatase activity
MVSLGGLLGYLSEDRQSKKPITVKENKQPDLKKAFTNSIGMEFVLVPKGRSWLGGSGGKPGTQEVEIPRDFYLGVYEVTQEEWQKVMRNNPSSFQRVAGVSKEDQKRFPVENVSWEDAQLFLTKLNDRDKQAGWVYRLPKEVEWEYACRGGPLANKVDSAFDFYFDNPTNQLLPDQANFRPGKQGLERPCKVGLYRPNRLGLYDMHGNLFEWCYAEKDAEGGARRVLRGGCWGATPGQCAAASRNPLDQPNHHYCNHGFRPARVPIGQEGK